MIACFSCLLHYQKTSGVFAHMRKVSALKAAHSIELFHNLYPLQRKSFCFLDRSVSYVFILIYCAIVKIMSSVVGHTV